jgi:hypothetical protein
MDGIRHDETDGGVSSSGTVVLPRRLGIPVGLEGKGAHSARSVQRRSQRSSSSTRSARDRAGRLVSCNRAKSWGKTASWMPGKIWVVHVRKWPADRSRPAEHGAGLWGTTAISKAPCRLRQCQGYTRGPGMFRGSLTKGIPPPPKSRTSARIAMPRCLSFRSVMSSNPSPLTRYRWLR